MSNVASLELCETLFELSGWNDWVEFDPYHNLALDWRQWAAKTGKIEVVSKANTRVTSITEFIAPAYDLGYLLRKLPCNSKVCKFTSTFKDGEHTHYEAIYEYEVSGDRTSTWERADTPEDAAAELLILLFKEGVLK